MSTAYHPEINGQSERLNRGMEQSLRCYESYQQDEWAQCLPMAEFAANNQEASTTQVTPFFVNYAFHPCFDSHLTPLDHSPQAIDAKNLANTMADLHDFLRTEILSSQDRFGTSTKKSRTPASAYRVGNQVVRSIKNIGMARISRKLGCKRIGPFTVKTVVSPYHYELAFPVTVELHHVLHVSLLDPALSNPVNGQVILPPQTVVIDDNEEYEIEEILDSKLGSKRPRYYVIRTGYCEPTWEHGEYHADFAAVEAFHHRYPPKPGLGLLN